MNHLRAFLCILAVLPVFGGAATVEPFQHRPATLQIGLWTLWHDKEILISPATSGKATIRFCEQCASTPLQQPIAIRAFNADVALPNNSRHSSIFTNGPISLSAHGETVNLSNPLHITSRAGELILSVTLPVETYVERVVASESGSADSLESLKALAIVVRSFALHQQHGHTDYDLCDSTHCQLLHWGSIGDRRAAAHIATLSTAGETLWYHRERVEAWFHQNCGGRTASPSEVWPTRSHGVKQGQMPWLASRPDSYCTSNGAREWSSSLSLAELTSALGTAGLVRPGWKTLSVTQRGESGRAVKLMVGVTEVSAEDLRLAIGRTLGWGRILSTWFEVVPQGDQFLFHGRGSGHGVGLCQAGAAAMAGRGHDSGQIIEQYFPGAIAADETSGRTWQSLHGQGFSLETMTPADQATMPQLEQALAAAEARSSLHAAGPITVRSFASTAAFRDATLAPGWVAAFTEGEWIGTQPLSTLATRKLLVPTLQHEFLHALVEAQAAPNTPLWLREGLVETWANDGPMTRNAAPALKVDDADRALSHATTEAESASAHRAAGWLAQRALERYGKTRVIAWLRTGIPTGAVSALR